MNEIIKIFEKGGVKYRLLDYIQSTGTQSIKLGNSIPFNTDNTIIECDFQFTEVATDSNAKWLFSNQGSSGNMCDFYSQVNTEHNGFYLRPSASQTSQVGVIIPHDTNKHHMKADFVNKKLYFDDDVYTLGYTQSSQTAPMYLFRRANTNTGYAKIKLFNFKYTRVLHHDFDFDLIPVERISDNAIGLLDLVSGTLYTNAGSGTFGKGYQQVEHIYKPKYKVKTYEKLEYIQSSGTQYIDLGVKAKGSLKVESDFQFTQAVDSALFVGRNAIQNSASGFIITDLGKWRSDYGNDITPSTLNGDTNKHHLVKDKGKTYLDNNLIISVADQTFESSYNLYLFARNSALTIGALAKAKVWYFKVWDNGTLIRDFVPVKRLKDNAIGMLDILTNTFYGNSGTGAFTGQSKSTPEYIEEDVEQVDYIEKNADGAYINLNISNHNYKNFGYETDIYVLKKDNGSWPALYGSLSGTNYDGTGNYGFYLHNSDNQVSVRAGTGNGQVGNHSATTLLNNWCNVIYKRVDTTQDLTINGNKQTRTGGNNGGTNLTPFLFGVNNGSGIVHDFQARIRKFKAYENNILVRDFIPVKYGTEYCLLDLVEMKLYHNKGTGAFSGGTRTEVQKLTQCYVANNTKYYALDYIKTDGNSVIDTGVIVKKNITKLEIDCNITTSDNNHQIGCGGTDADVIFFTRGFVYLLTTSASGTAFTIPINQRKKYIADAVNNQIGYEGNLISLTPTANQSVDTFTIGARKNNGAYELKGADIIYDFKAYENNVLVKHLVPVERADGVKGMLDLVGGTFITNASSGSLVAGNKREIILVE